jgi:tRNA(Ile)-lysidine synthase
MPPKRGKIIRPLIDIPREDILKYLAKKGMDYRIDETNYDIRFLRSRVRHRILPFLEKQIHPNIQVRVGRLADIIRSDDTYLQQKAREVLQSVQQNIRGRPALVKSQLDDLPLALRRRAVREFLRSLRGETAGLTFDDIERCLDLKKEQVFPLEKGLKLKNIRGFITLESKSAPLNYDLIWDGQSPLIIQETGQKLTLATRPNPGTARLEFNDKKKVWLDAQKIFLPLRVRNRLPGDRYRPLGAPGRKALKEMFRSRDIAPDERDRFPVILSQDEIIWVAGLPAAHDFRVTDKTAAVMKIDVE